MASSVLILHGWSDKAKSFHGLRDFLLANGWQTSEVWLSDYISLDDDVRIDDVGKRMNDVVRDALASGQLKVPFDLIVHSTAGSSPVTGSRATSPTARAVDGTPCPVKRLIMLAPANFGSPLAHLGRSMLGRIFKGWNNWLQVGAGMLSALELASAYQWDLASRDLFDRGKDGHRPYGKDRVWPFVIVGTRGYVDHLLQMVNEKGSDGTVRCAAANLNAIGLTVDSARAATTPW